MYTHTDKVSGDEAIRAAVAQIHVLTETQWLCRAISTGARTGKNSQKSDCCSIYIVKYLQS